MTTHVEPTTPGHAVMGITAHRPAPGTVAGMKQQPGTFDQTQAFLDRRALTASIRWHVPSRANPQEQRCRLVTSVRARTVPPTPPISASAVAGKNSNLHAAKAAKNDEFYTLYDHCNLVFDHLKILPRGALRPHRWSIPWRNTWPPTWSQ